ncbi:cell division ATP-binding protein FtsE [Desulfosporosinus sp. BICA1-9]|uniref:cell division ATP-binding protein FtsE n=1 Tax=Desulfosporosinus sp. BICA1-9 TaxID=1531958 RepID=UPI00054B96DD|nr:ATP-binding cassette domain-containing protein [Desulfosporosinus sp. BICA1-9]KJS49243.1 MAG: ABC transporter [Peptococcaceae bacterium BRH_c23]KJS84943.1 MAG: ABC transporter [Desulfosporosinus sp. BICA1-9]HBW34573.1 ABC transporter [Desulfosporosinus sp.]
MIEAKGVSLRFPNGTMALKDIDLQVEPGDMVYVTGPSGSGKTSLLKIFMGIEYPTVGSLKVLGQPMTKGQTAGIRQLRKIIGPVFQEFKLIAGRTVMENVMLGMRFLDLPQVQLKDNASNALVKVGLEHKALSLVENLSWGESQRVAIARAVARKPVLILADEPTGNLDKDNALNILELLTSFVDEKTAVVITTHATHLINAEKNSKYIRMDNGSLSWERLG